MVVDLGDGVGIFEVGGKDGGNAAVDPELVTVFEQVFDDGRVAEKSASGLAADVVDDAGGFAEWRVAAEDFVAVLGVVAVDVANVVKFEAHGGGQDAGGEGFARAAAAENPEAAARQ